MRQLLYIYLLLFLLSPSSLLGQRKDSRRPFHMQYEFKEGSNFFQNATSLNKKRQRISSRILAGAYVGIFSYMGLVWYAGEDLSGFHFFDDSHEWKQMDKVGHVMGGFQCSRYVTSMLKWSGVPKKRAIIQGSLSGLAVMSTIEIFDAFGESWGFSWSDMGANVLGSGLSVANQAIWNEDRLQLKMSYIKSPYAGDPEFERLFGSTYPEWFLKDYNGQAYWLSVRVHSFLPESSFKDKYPPWLNLAVGYGAEGLEGGYDIDESWRAREYRQLYLSIDLDLDNIKTRSALLKRVLSALNLIRIPLPALQFDKTGVKFLPLR